MRPVRTARHALAAWGEPLERDRSYRQALETKTAVEVMLRQMRAGRAPVEGQSPPRFPQPTKPPPIGPARLEQLCAEMAPHVGACVGLEGPTRGPVIIVENRAAKSAEQDRRAVTIGNDVYFVDPSDGALVIRADISALTAFEELPQALATHHLVGASLPPAELRGRVVRAAVDLLEDWAGVAKKPTRKLLSALAERVKDADAPPPFEIEAPSGGLPSDAYYDRVSEVGGAEAISVRSQLQTEQFVRGFLADLSPGSRILDVGSGGPSVPGLARDTFGHHVVPVDLSPRMVAEARAAGFDARRADARALPFDAAHFDAALQLCVAVHLSPSDFATSLRELRRVLKDGALALVALNITTGPSEVKLHAHRRVAALAEIAPTPIYVHNEDEVLAAVRRSGFSIGAQQTLEPLPDVMQRYLYLCAV